MQSAPIDDEDEIVLVVALDVRWISEDQERGWSRVGCEMHLLDQRSMVRLQDLIAKAAPWPVKTSRSGAKVCVPAAENPGMAHEQPKPPQNDAIRAEARALEDSVRAIRRAQGKRNPEDCVPGSAESSAVMEAFVRDVGRVLALDMLEREKGKDID